mgnify:CR=1 FL=1
MKTPKVWNKRDPNTPKDAVYVGRPTIWGNPFSHLPSVWATQVPTREDAITAYREWISSDAAAGLRAKAKDELRNRDLVCWCAPRSCHGDVLLALANEENNDE